MFSFGLLAKDFTRNVNRGGWLSINLESVDWRLT